MKKNIFGKIALAAAVVPCALVMASCGGSQLETKADVNTRGNYVATASQTEMNEYVAQENVKTEMASGYHVTYEIKATEEMSMFVNAYFKMNDSGVITEAAMKMDVPTLNDMKVNYWIKDGVCYAESTFGESIIKTKYTMDQGDSASDLLEAADGIMVSANDFLDSFGEMNLGNEGKFKYEVAKSNTSTKYHAYLNEAFSVEMSGMKMDFSKSDIYLVFENDQFVGAKYNTNYKMTVGEESYDSSMYAAITTFNGNIEYPDFSGFTETNFGL